MWWSSLFENMRPSDFFNFSFFPKYGTAFVRGIEYTLLLAVVSVLLAVVPALLLALMEKPDIPVSREQLLRRAWGYQSMGETRTVDVHVQRLRKKLGGEYIETVYKCGYRLKLA